MKQSADWINHYLKDATKRLQKDLQGGELVRFVSCGLPFFLFPSFDVGSQWSCRVTWPARA